MGVSLSGRTRGISPGMHRITSLTLASAVLLAAASAQADSNRPLAGLVERKPDRPRESIFIRNTTVARLNPLGLMDFGQVSYRMRLYDSESVAFADNFIGFGLAPAISPAFARIGPLVEFQPTSFLQLWASFEMFGYFGTFGFLQSFPDASADFSDSEINARRDLADGDPGRPYASTGTQVNLGATLQAKLGPFAVRNLFRLMRPDYRARGGDEVVYDIIFDVLTPNRGWFINNDTDLLYVSDFGLSAGVRWTSNFAFYQERHLAGADENLNTPMHRVGPLLAYSFWKDRGGDFDNPTLLLIANWWVKHRWRTGEDVNQAMPYLVLGFQFTGDITPSDW